MKQNLLVSCYREERKGGQGPTIPIVNTPHNVLETFHLAPLFEGSSIPKSTMLEIKSLTYGSLEDIHFQTIAVSEGLI